MPLLKFETIMSPVAVPHLRTRQARTQRRMTYRQSFVDDDPYQPTAESALASKGRCVLRGREQTIFYSNGGSVRTVKNAVRDKME